MLDKWIACRLGLTAPLIRHELAARQLERLNDTLSYARTHSVFYRERFPELTLHSFDDFAALPFTTPSDLKQFNMQMLCVSPNDIDRVVTLQTSGSTGNPKRVFFTSDDQQLTVDYFCHGMGEFVFPGDRIMSLFPGTSPGSLNDLLGRGLAQMGAKLFLFGFPSPDQYGQLLDQILSEHIVSLVGPASAIGGAARYSAQCGLDAALSSQLESVLLAAEFVSDSDWNDIDRFWHCRINEHYGMTETGLCGAVGCSVPGGYHVWESDLYYEVVNPVTGEALPDGQLGEIVVTTLTRKGMPFIRYRTGDISCFSPVACNCGSVLRRLERVHNRPQQKKFTGRQIPNTLTEI